jgi:hypothetical protein
LFDLVSGGLSRQESRRGAWVSFQFVRDLSVTPEPACGTVDPQRVGRLFQLSLRIGGDNRPISWTTRLRLAARSYIFFQLDFLQEAGPRFLPASWRIAAGSGTRVRLRSSLSQCRSRRSGLLSAGPKAWTRLFYADARFANRIRLLAMGDGASRRTTSITIGSGFAGAAVFVAEGPSPFCLCFLCLTRITAFWHAAKRCCGGLWSSAHGRRHCPSFWILIGCLTHPLSAAGQAAWTVLIRRLPFSARLFPALLIG